MDISELSQIVFPVIGYRNSEYLFLGNGFFLENPNTFITAAHILKDKAIVCEKFYYMPNGCLLPLIPVSDNLIYDPKPENSLPIFKDLAIFKTENPFNKYLHLGSIQITRNSSLVCTGFHEPLSTLETPLPLGINAIPDISRLEFEQYSLNVSHPQKADIKFKQHEHIDNDLVYTNCFDCDGE